MPVVKTHCDSELSGSATGQIQIHSFARIRISMLKVKWALICHACK